MYLKKYHLFIFLCIILSSCRYEKENHNRNITKQIKVNDQTNGKLSDSTFYYYKDGKIKKKGLLENGLMTGWWIFYDSLGNLSKKEQYKIIGDSLYKNQVIYYDSGDNINYEFSSFYEIELPDTLQVGKNVGRIKKYNSNFKANHTLISVIVENKYGLNEIRKDTFSDGTLKPFFGIFAPQKGNQKVELVIIETILNEGSTALKIEKHKKFFEKTVYVTDSL